MFLAADGVDRHNFKTCKDSGFCKRLRGDEAVADSVFKVDPSVVVGDDDTVVQATLVNTANDVRFKLELWPIRQSDGGLFRVTIREAYPLKERFQPAKEVLVSETPEVARWKTIEQSSDMIHVCVGESGDCAKVHFNPFKLEFLRSGQVLVVGNANGKMVFEETKQRGEGEAAETESFKGHTDTRPNGNTAVRLDFTFMDVKHIYGLPEHTDGLALKDTENGDPYRLYNLDVFEYELNERMALYASVPFLMAPSAKHTAGLFWLNAAETWVDVDHSSKSKSILGTLSGMVGGASDSEKDPPAVTTTWLSESGLIDAFVMLGESAGSVSRQFNTLTGTTPLPPLFALGYHQCRWNYRDQEDVAEVNANLDNFDIPADVIWLDIEHTDGKRYFTWDKTKFSQPEEMIAGLSAVGRKLVNIVDPHVKVDSGYSVYQECKDKDLFVKDKNGNEFNGWCWPGNSAYADFLNPAAREWFAEQYEFDKYKGTTNDVHIWNDMNEPSVFNGPEVTMHKDSLHHGNVEHRDMHNIYGHLYTMATHMGIVKRSKGTLRPFVLTRSAFAGTQRYAALWTGDNTAQWDHLEASIPMCLSLSLAGITFCGADVGGFFGNPDAELMIRWYQAAVWQPFFRSHAHIDTKRREPWVFGDDKMAYMRDAIKTRYNILPLYYTLFYELEKVTGLPPMRPLFYEFPEIGEEGYRLESQHMVGGVLMVAPVTKPGVASWDVHLPPSGLWYEYATGKKAQQTGDFSVDVNLHSVPVWQRGGTVLPTLQRPRRSSAVMINDPYTLTVALDGEGKAAGSLYIDDGQSYEYRDGKNVYIRFNFSDGKLTASRGDGTHQTAAWLEAVKVLGWPSKPSSVALGGNSLGFKYDAGTQVLTVRKPGVNLSEKNWSIDIKS